MQFQPLIDRRILLVEDEALIPLDLRESLTEAGASVTTAFTLKQATAVLDDQSISLDAAVLDFGLLMVIASTLADRLKSNNIPS